MATDKKQWNFKNVPADVYEKVISIQARAKIAGKSKTSIEQICYTLIRKGAGLIDTMPLSGKQV